MDYLIHKYKTSKDYNKLWELSKTQRIVCFVNYGDNSDIRDVCQTQPMGDENGGDVGARGISYISAFDFNGKSAKEYFTEQCIKKNLEFIDPDSQKEV